jgi:hypothetical protein
MISGVRSQKTPLTRGQARVAVRHRPVVCLPVRLFRLLTVRLLSVVFSATAEEGLFPGSPVTRSIRPLPAHVERTLHTSLCACAVVAAEVANPMGGFDAQRWRHQRSLAPTSIMTACVSSLRLSTQGCPCRHPLRGECYCYRVELGVCSAVRKTKVPSVFLLSLGRLFIKVFQNYERPLAQEPSSSRVCTCPCGAAPRPTPSFWGTRSLGFTFRLGG